MSAVDRNPLDAPNEARADRGMQAVETFTDRNHSTDGRDGLATDIADLIADLFHLAERHGLTPSDLYDSAERHWQMDEEDGARVAAFEGVL